MKFALGAIAIYLITPMAFATSNLSNTQTIESKAATIAQDLERQGRHLSQQERAEISSKLDAIKAILKQSEGELPNSNTAGYLCTARDNDDRNPYVFALKKGNALIRIPETVFNSKSECEAGINSIVELKYSRAVCLSRDNDGRTPFVLAQIHSSKVKPNADIVFATALDCQKHLETFIDATNVHVKFCTSRDNDGRRPYIRTTLNLKSFSNSSDTSEEFGSIERCRQTL